MNARTARIQVTTAVIVLVLLTMGTTARVAGQTGATSSTTTETTSQSSTNSTITQEESVASETSSASSQVAENLTTGDSVNVMDLDPSEQSQILAAETNGTIAGEIEVNDSGVFASVTDPRFSLAPTEGADGRLDIQVTGQNVTGPRSFLITLSKAMDPTSHILVVILDGSRVLQATSLPQVIYPTSDTANYMVVKSSSGYQLLVSVPHFSIHQLTILPIPFGPLQGFFSISIVSLATAMVAITAIFAVAFAARKRISPVVSGTA